MGTLARIDPVVLQTALDDHPRVADMRPLDRNTQPGVAAAPSSRTHQNVTLLLIGKAPVDLLNLVSDRLVVGRIEGTCLDVDHILHVIDDAMPQDTGRAQDGLLIGDGRQVLVHHLLVVHDRPDLQQVEGRLLRIRLVDIDRELDLNRASHLRLTDLQQLIERLRQRKDIVLKDIHERENLSPTRIITIPNNLVVWIIRRDNILQRALLIRVLQAQLDEVKGIVYGEVLRRILQVQRIKTGLCLLQGKVHRTHLQDTVWMPGRETQRQAAIYDIFTQAQRDIGDTILSLLITDRVEVQRTGHTRDGRIEMILVAVAHHLLQDNSHLLLVDQVGGRRHISLTVTIEHRSIDRLDRIAHDPQHLILLLDLRHHIG